jgi:predicted flap endonuclease-1-like 5' DNA nuclease
MLPTPRVPAEPPPHFRNTPPPPDSTPDDLTLIKGIGPVYANRLGDAGIDTFAGLAAADADGIASATGVAPQVASGWIEQARGRIT